MANALRTSAAAIAGAAAFVMVLCNFAFVPFATYETDFFVSVDLAVTPWGVDVEAGPIDRFYDWYDSEDFGGDDSGGDGWDKFRARSAGPLLLLATLAAAGAALATGLGRPRLGGGLAAAATGLLAAMLALFTSFVLKGDDSPDLSAGFYLLLVAGVGTLAAAVMAFSAPQPAPYGATPAGAARGAPASAPGARVMAAAPAAPAAAAPAGAKRCPRCKTVVPPAPGKPLVCPFCGFK